MEIKYLTDGRKVAVVGQLNNNETIVQEIFVTENGDEIPSGERFVTKSLHTEPVMSWKQKEENKLEKRLLSCKSSIAQKEKEERELIERIKAYSAIVKSNEKLVKLLPEDELETFSMFITGNVEYLVLNTYRIERPVKLIDQIIDFESRWGERRFDSLKLLSVMGKSEGKLDYRIHRYSDGSGGSYSNVYPCKDYESALNKIKEIAMDKIEKGYLSKDELDLCIELGIVFDSETIKKCVDKIKELTLKNIENATKTLKSHQETVDKYNKELESLDNLY